jgi:tetratricopeptide (TPR) repeat protein
MKAIIFILGILFITNSNAQKFDCSSKTKEYQELLQVKKFNESFDIWTDVRKNCPKENEAVYTDGIQILQYKIDVATSEQKEKAVRDLMKLYDQYNKNFPSAVPDFEVYKAMALANSKIESKEEIFNLLDSGFTKASQNITDARAIYTYFTIYTERFAAGDKKITSNAVLDKYTLVNTMLTQLQVSKPENKDYAKTQNAINKLIKDIATCENLADFYTKDFEKNKDNADWINSALISLSEKCSSKPIFMALAEKLYSIRPDAQSASFIALGYSKQRKFTEAIKFYTESAEKQSNPLEKAKIYYMLGSGLLANDLPKSKEFIGKALAADPKMGRAYIYLAQMYVNNSKDCSKTDFEKKAIYYLAIQTVQKAGIAEPNLKPTSDKMAADYAANSLTPSEISKEKMNGKSVTIDCWIKETVTFPSK